MLPIGCGLITVFLVYKAVCLMRGDSSLIERKPGEIELKE